jgi:hypothetical protein
VLYKKSFDQCSVFSHFILCCEFQTKFQIQVQLGLWRSQGLRDKIPNTGSTWFVKVTRVERQNTKYRFNLVCDVTNLTNQCVVQKIFWSVLCIFPFHFVLWIPGLHEQVGIQINFFEKTFLFDLVKKRCKFKCESLVFLNKSLKHEKCFNMVQGFCYNFTSTGQQSNIRQFISDNLS